MVNLVSQRVFGKGFIIFNIDLKMICVLLKYLFLIKYPIVFSFVK